MAENLPTGIAHRLLAMVTAAMPPSRRDWGRAMSAELAYARSRGERARLVLGAARLALLPRGAADYRRAVGRAAVLAAIAYVPLGLGLYLADVVFPAAQDSAAGVLAMHAYLLLALMTVGARARRASARRGAPVIAGMAAGLVMALLGMATFAVIDHAHINSTLEATAPGVALVGIVAGAVFAPIGAALAPEAATTWSHLRHLSRR